MPQPVPKHIKQNNPNAGVKPYNTLLIDGSNILELSSLGDTTLSSNGKQTGGIFQFLLQVRMMLSKGNFRYVYVFWDGESSGLYRWRLYPMYKMNRDKEFNNEEGLSDYMKEVNAKIKNMQSYIFNKKKPKDPEKAVAKAKHKDLFFWQREIIMQCLEDLFIRQCLCDETEADDFIGYYVAHKEPNERIVIMSNDRDLTQLISDDVTVYVQSLKQFVTPKNHKEIMGYDYRNVALKKVLCGDSSDNIKGIKGLGEKTLMTNFPDFIDRKVSLEEVIEGARQINENRVANKKPPLKWAENIVNRVTDGVQGDKIYEINQKIIDLSDPLMPEEAKELMESMMYAPLDPDGRSMEDLYKILLDSGIDQFKDASYFATFFSNFGHLIDQEKKKSAAATCISI